MAHNPSTLIIVGAALLAWHGLALAQASTDQTKRWIGGGQVNAEGIYRRPDVGDYTAGVGVAEVVLGAEAQVNDWIGGEIGLLYEKVDIGLDDGEAGESIMVDVATLTVGAPQGWWACTAGRQYAPFGVFATNFIADPLTLELGEINEWTVQFGWASGGLHGSLFGFNGGYGAAIGYSLERGGLNLSYISDIGASGAFQEVIADAPGWTARAELRYANATLIGEYLTALEHFAGRGARPSSWLLEAAYAVRLTGKEATVVVGYQGTEEARALKLPTRRLLVGLSVELATWFSPAIEWVRDEDYASTTGGRGQQVSTTAVQFAVAF